MIHLSDHAEGVILPVKAQPRARKNAVMGEQAGALKVAVTAPPEDGKANAALIESLATFLGLRRSQIKLLSGQTSRDKKFLISGVSKTELEHTITSQLNQK